MGEGADHVVMHCAQIQGKAGLCQGLQVQDDSLRIESIHVTPVALMLMHAGLPIGQYVSSGKLPHGGQEIDLARYRLDSVDFKPLYTVPFVLRNVRMTRTH